MDSRGLFQSKPFWIAAAFMLAVMGIGGAQSELLYMALPVIAALPYSNSLLDDLTTGFWKYAVCRTSKHAYLSSKIAVSWIAGAAVMAIAGLTCPAPLFVLVMHCLCAGTCALLAMAASLITHSRATAWFAPFLAEYFLVILNTRYFPNINALNPQRWLTFGVSGLLLPLAAAALCGTVCWKVGKRRLTP